ncbi:tRNA (guanosine(37)-N1)-methyltransferase TrmD [Desulfogranum mediterraneum]|uniref:tRNA (guanosine(37)-N1)-methyltransferase TrmD n=1 Tax=Desulfogranum mediterraneum TaxID=160661 RepID=UPI0004131C5D|nr:tRNA (guanosine(37)-N1)-methyltransferase TrmD [Desulfogranum mediterraneum]
MRFDILTIFPDFFDSPMQEGILRRAQAAGQIRVAVHNIRDYALDRHKMTDDRPFGGGEGMVMKPEPLLACLDDLEQREQGGPVVLLSPRGRQFSQKVAEELAAESRLVLVCGRYEGVDQRFTDRYVDQEISIGDYVLSGGELAAMVMVDAITRLLPEVLGCSDSALHDTFSRGLLKHSQYTRPREFQGMGVPGPLLSGDHAAIRGYRFLESVELTLEKRPDLLAGVRFSPEEVALLRKSGLWVKVKEVQEG